MNNSSRCSSTVADLHHQIVDNERFMMKYAAENSSSVDSHHRPLQMTNESIIGSNFTEQTQSLKKSTPLSTVQSGNNK